MPRGMNPNSLKALSKNRKKTQFNGERAVKAAEKSNAAQALNAKIAADLKEQLTPESIRIINERLIRMAEHGNLKAYVIIRDMLGEKPTDKLAVDGTWDFAETLREARERAKMHMDE